MSYEKINHPKHYQSQNMEVIEVINEYQLNYNLGNVVKYILRAGKKPDVERVVDLKKALWYLTHEIGLNNTPDIEEQNRHK